MSQAKMIIAAAALAAAGSAANGAMTWNDTVALTTLEPVRMTFPGWGEARGAADGVVDTTITMPNFVGTDLVSMNIKILPDQETSYGPGELEAIVFDQSVTPTAMKFGMPVGSFNFDDDKNLFWTFSAGEYTTGDFVTFTFTILTPNMQLFDIEFEPNIPTPGSLALAGMAGLAGIRRRR
ncbi:MAG: hypothetical protein KDA21_11890 [Phycisphaerales bacterium]|nr:hypothetical protein [Phycisphaerales bacterium]